MARSLSKTLEPSSGDSFPPDGGGDQQEEEEQHRGWISVRNRRSSATNQRHTSGEADRYPRKHEAWTDRGKGATFLPLKRSSHGSKVRSNIPPTRFVPLVNSQSKPITWVSVVTKGSLASESESLTYFPPVSDDGKCFAFISTSEMMESRAHWEKSILLYVVGARPNFLHLKAFATRVWKPKCNFEIFSRDNGFFLFKFEDETECGRILDEGPWFFDGKLIVVRRWSSSLTLDRDLLKTIPVWIRLPTLSLSFWNATSISKITSVVGIPLKLDVPTRNRERLSYARILVEISAEGDLPNTVMIKTEEGQVIEQTIQYEWLPPKCIRCNCFGHVISHCSPNVSEVWVPKNVQLSDTVSDKHEAPSSIPISDSTVHEIRETDNVMQPVLSTGPGANSSGNLSVAILHEPEAIRSYASVVTSSVNPPLGDDSLAGKQTDIQSASQTVPVVSTGGVSVSVSSSVSSNLQGPSPKKATKTHVGNSETWAKKGFLSKGFGGSKKLSNNTIFDVLDAMDSDEDVFVEEDEDMRSDSDDHIYPSESTYANPQWEELMAALSKGKEKKGTGRRSKTTSMQKGFNMALRSSRKT